MGADKISTEIFEHLCFMCEPYSSCTADSFKDFIMLIFNNLQGSIFDDSVSEELSGRYCALVYLIMHHFLDVRHRMASGETLAPHILPALDALAGVDTAKDVKLIFRLLDVCMRTADTISFADINTENTDDDDIDKSGDTALSLLDFEDTGNTDEGRGGGERSELHPSTPCITGAPSQQNEDDLHGIDMLLVEFDEFHEGAFDESPSVADHFKAEPLIEQNVLSLSSMNDAPQCISFLEDNKEDPVSQSQRKNNATETSAATAAVGDLMSDGFLVDHVITSNKNTLEGPDMCESKLLLVNTQAEEADSTPLFSSIIEAVTPLTEPATPTNDDIIREPAQPASTPRNKAFYDWVKVRGKSYPHSSLHELLTWLVRYS